MAGQERGIDDQGGRDGAAATAFERLCKDFGARRPSGKPVSSFPLFDARWENGSVNSLLLRGLRERGLEHIGTIGGDVWVLHRGGWKLCDHGIECRGGEMWARFWLCGFEGRQ
ncbi:MAG: hypothetical protein LBS32_07655 [Clostridiales Family XIII bacterium]|nr:hypothetical protein [Clostridiales Family XIII bacterium]